MTTALSLGGGVIKFATEMFTYVAHFDRKVGIYIATKLFQFASRKELHANRAGRLFSALLAPSGIFFNSFAVKARAGPHGSYDKPRYLKYSVR